jgi:hypothetical protein
MPSQRRVGNPRVGFPLGWQACGLRWIVYQHDAPSDLKDRLLGDAFETSDVEAILALDLRLVSLLLPHFARRRRFTPWNLLRVSPPLTTKDSP